MLEGPNFVKFFFFSFHERHFFPEKRQGTNYVNAKTFFFWRFTKWGPVFLNVPKNAEKYAKIIFHSVSRLVCGRCLMGHIADEGVTW